MPTAVRRHSRGPTSALWIAVIATTLAVHGALLGFSDQLGGLLIGKGVTPAAHASAVESKRVDLETTCAGDVMLATTARAALCLAPWRGDVAGCGDELEMAMWMDLSSCRVRNDSIAPIAMAMVAPRQVAQLTPIDPEPLLEELAQLQQPPPPPPPPPPPQVQQQPPPPPPPPPPQRPSQVVETVKPNSEQEPDNARFLAEHNTKVEKQQVARGARNEPLVAKSKPEELTAKTKPKDDPSIAKPPDKPPGKNPAAPDAPGTLTMRAPGAPAPVVAAQDAKTQGAQGKQGPIVSDGFIPRRGDGAVEQQRRDPGELTKGQGGAGGGQPVVPNLKPSKEQLERIVGGGSVDHLDDVENGDETALSAKRWIYASFFNRMKRQVAQSWDPQTVWRRSDPNGTAHGGKTRITEVRVSLSGKGELSKVVVVNPSGVRELDDEAVRAFHAAAPFPNPPDGLVKDGLITFEFSFHFEIGSPRSSWRVIRSN